VSSPERIYTCDFCLKTFNSGWTDEEALAEYENDFIQTGLYSQEELENPGRVCEDCWEFLTPIIKETEKSLAAERNS